VCVLVAVAAGLVGAGAAAAREAPLLRGICDPSLIESWRTRGPAVVQEFGTRLGADVVRVNLRWSECEERQGVYDEDYLGRALSAVRAIRAQGMQAAVVVYQAPPWASDRRFWDHPVPGDRAGVYQKYYPPSISSLDAFQAFSQHLAESLQGEVLAYSCWIEPNLWTYLYPQRTTADPAFAAHRYTRMLAAFSQGIRAGDPAARVAAGETSPTGNNTRLRTSPLRFARQIRDAGAAEYFDVYAHHPYPVSGNKDISPDATPRDPSETVWLANLPTLLGVFPDKPYYLSEFAYSTAYSILFGVWVTEAQQASYLAAAYRIAESYPQVQMLTWFPRRDHSRSGTYADRLGVYCGLRDLRGNRKRAYYAYAGGNQLTMRAPSSVRRGATLTLRGRLTSERMGPLAAKSLVVMAHLPGRSWVNITRTHTRSDGTYLVRLRPQRGATWRVRWSGVVDSPSDWVPVTTR
jgi:hypothetical protein